MTEPNLQGRVALVVGGQPEVSSAVSCALANSGCVVAIAEPADRPAGAVTERASAALTVSVDLVSPESTQGMIRAVVDEFGRIDVLINGDNYYLQALRAPWIEIDPAEWDTCFANIVRANWLSCRAVARYMKAQQWGRIVTIGSTAAWSGATGFLQYTTATSALIGITRSLARELGDFGVSVNMVCPDPDKEVERTLRAGSAVADFVPYPPPVLDGRDAGPRRVGPEGVAGSILFLIGPDSGFITGQSYLVNGGSWMQ
jgi:NAD(P)-dependent dehydrogenase (short-subunit alcohol dehydrogenase family)